MRRSKIILCIVFWLVAYGALAQYTLYQHITVKDGLPSDYVMSMLFDKQGIFWIGTDKGLCRYDGSSMQILTMDNGLGGNSVNAIYQDLKGDIWTSGYEAGIAKIGMHGDRILVEKVLKKGVTVSDLKQDDAGYYWLKTSIPGTTKYQYWKAKNLEASWELVVSFVGYNQLVVDQNGIVCYNSTTPLYWENANTPKKAITPKNVTDSLQVLSSGRKILVKGIDYGYIFSADGSVDTLSYVPPLLNGVNCRFLSSFQYDILYKTGQRNYLYQKGKLVQIIGDAAKDGEQFFFFTAAADAYGNVYFSHFGEGILVWRTPYIHQYDVPQKVGRIAIRNKQVNFLAGTQFYGVDSTNLRVKASPVKAFGDVIVHAIDDFSKPVIATSDACYDIHNKLLHAWPLDFLDLSDMLVHSTGYYLSSYSFGVQRQINHVPDTAWNHALKLSSNSVERLRLFNNTLYALSLSNGVTAIDLRTASTQKIDKSAGLLSNSVYDVLQEGDSLWIGTALGITKIVHGTASSFAATQGFDGKRVVAIFRDKSKRLWVLSDTYLHLYRGTTLLPIRSHPIITDNRAFIIAAGYQSATNTLWVGTNRSLLAVTMDQVVLNAASYPVSIRQVYLGDSITDFSSGSISLDNDHGLLRIFFANPHYSIYTQPIVYARMLGFDDNWKKLNREFLLEYNKLPAGEYVLEIKTEGPDLGKTQAKQLLRFQVLPPWWKRAWMIIIYIFFASSIAFGISRLIAKRKYQSKLQKIEAEQALQLERSRISRELHDNVGSMLTVMINRMEDEPLLQMQQQVSITDIARNTLSQLRDAIWALDKNSLTLAQWMSRSNQYLKQLQSNETTIETEFDWPENLSLSPVKALHSFRILQEACANAIKHAKPSIILVNGYVEAQQLVLVILNNGRGFDVSDIKYGYGLKNMMKRAGEMGGALEVSSTISSGTTITLRWFIT